MTKNQGRTPYIINEIRTHQQISQDEWTAWFLLKNFGGNLIEITDDCQFIVDTKTDVSDFFIEQQYRKQGILFLGVGGGQFDEHPFFGANRKMRKENECCATRVAKYLGVDQHPALQIILQVTLDDDQGNWPKEEEAGIRIAHLSLPKMIKRMYTNGAVDLERLKDYVFTFLSEVYEEQRIFHSAPEEIIKNGTIHKFALPERPGKSYSMLTIESDHPKVHDFAFAKTYHQFVLKINPDPEQRNWQLFVRRDTPFRRYLKPLVGAIRLKEARLNGNKIERKDLQEEGSVPGAPAIHFFEKSGMISNGTLTHDVPPSKFDPRDIPAILERILIEARTQLQQKQVVKPEQITPNNYIPTESNEDVTVHQTIG